MKRDLNPSLAEQLRSALNITSEEVNPERSDNEKYARVSEDKKRGQKLVVAIERSGRAGKTVTLVKNFIGEASELEALAKLLKQKCGVGGSAKEGVIIIQGDKREALVDILTKEGYNAKRGN